MSENAVKVQCNRIVITSDNMKVNKRYYFKHNGESYCAVKGRSGRIYIYEVVEQKESR